MTKQPNQTNGVKPSALEQDIIGTANYLRQQGKPLHLMLWVDEAVFREKKKPELEPQLLKYGSILDNYDFSHMISLDVYDIPSLEAIKRDYELGKLKGIVVMELSPMDAVLCGYKAA